MFLFLTKLLRHIIPCYISSTYRKPDLKKTERYIFWKLHISDINLTLTSSGISDRWTNFLYLLEIAIDSVLDVLRKQAIFRPVNIFQDLCLVFSAEINRSFTFIEIEISSANNLILQSSIWTTRLFMLTRKLNYLNFFLVERALAHISGLICYRL